MFVQLRGELPGAGGPVFIQYTVCVFQTLTVMQWGFSSEESYLELEVAQDDTFFDPNTVTFSL